MKKRILIIALVVALLATCFGGTLAYLKDTHAVKNTFTAGNVYISLDEAKVKKNDDGNLVADGDARITAVSGQVVEQGYKLFPAMTVTKDPTITLNAGSENAYVAAKVTISGAALYDLIPMDGSADLININAVASGGLLAQSTTYGDYNGLAVFQNDNYAVYQVAEGNNTWTLYIFMKVAQVAGTKTVLFDTLTISENWDNAEMTKVNGMSIKVEAFAAQANGFASCFDAMTTAFKTQFPFATNP